MFDSCQDICRIGLNGTKTMQEQEARCAKGAAAPHKTSYNMYWIYK